MSTHRYHTAERAAHVTSTLDFIARACAGIGDPTLARAADMFRAWLAEPESDAQPIMEARATASAYIRKQGALTRHADGSVRHDRVADAARRQMAAAAVIESGCDLIVDYMDRVPLSVQRMEHCSKLLAELAE